MAGIKISGKEIESFAKSCKDFNPIHYTSASKQVVPGDLLVALWVSKFPGVLSQGEKDIGLRKHGIFSGFSYSFIKKVLPDSELSYGKEGLEGDGKVYFLVKRSPGVVSFTHPLNNCGDGLESFLSSGEFLKGFVPSDLRDEIDTTLFKGGKVDLESIINLLTEKTGENVNDNVKTFLEVFLNITPLGYKLQSEGLLGVPEDKVPVFTGGGLVLYKEKPFDDKVSLSDVRYGTFVNGENKGRKIRSVNYLWAGVNNSFVIYKSFIQMRKPRTKK